MERPMRGMAFLRKRSGAAACAALGVLCGCAAPPGTPVVRPDAAASAAAGEELERLHGVIDRAVEEYGKVREYRCVFQKRQRIRGVLQEPQRILLKFRKPMDVYMRWLSRQHEGQEILYAPARYGTRAIARAGGWKGAVTPPIPIDVDGYWVMRDNLHPLDRVGIGYFLDLFMRNARRAREEKASMLIDRGAEQISGRPAGVLESVLPDDPSRGYYCRRCVVWFDEGHGLPVKIMIYDWADDLTEEYLYENLDLQPGFTDLDFDRRNPAYRL